MRDALVVVLILALGMLAGCDIMGGMDSGYHAAPGQTPQHEYPK